jgi:hypothetical protein
MAEPHVRYAPYAPIADDQCVTLYLPKTGQQRGEQPNNAPEAKYLGIRGETSQRQSQDSVDEGRNKGTFKVERGVEAADIAVSSATQCLLIRL